MDYLIMAGQLTLSLSILIVLHEMGHFLPARLFGTRVEKFYLFFDAGFSLFKKQIGETEYGIGWLPLGGYVKISGMIDESFDTEQMQQEPQPWEFRSKPAWQRLIIMLGGVTVNFILGFLLYGMVLYVWGEEYVPNDRIEYGIYVDSLGRELGFQDGDQLVSVGGQPIERFSDRAILRGIVIDNARQITVRRDGQETVLPVDEKWTDILSRQENSRRRLFTARYPFVAGLIAKDSPAKEAGLEVGDSIVSFNEQPTPFFGDFVALAQDHKGETAQVGIYREGRPQTLDITLTDQGKIGVAPFDETYFFGTARKEYGLVEAVPAGFRMGWNFLGDQLKAFGQMFRGNIDPRESLGGFASIGRMFGDQWVWERFWTMTAVLSLILAFMNLLPIPALDGGHVMFLLYELVSGRKPSDRVLEIATMIGFVLVIGLVLFANGLDIWRWIKGVFGG
jgi:regulator of sigma E protease